MVSVSLIPRSRRGSLEHALYGERGSGTPALGPPEGPRLTLSEHNGGKSREITLTIELLGRFHVGKEFGSRL